VEVVEVVVVVLVVDEELFFRILFVFGSPEALFFELLVLRRL